MTIFDAIKIYLSRDNVQRIIYSLLLFIWFLLNWKSSIRDYQQISSIGVPYIWLAVVPAVVLSVQIAMNRKVLWMVILGLIASYSVVIIVSAIYEILNRSTSGKPVGLDATAILGMLTFLASLFTVNWIVYRMKPVKGSDKREGR